MSLRAAIGRRPEEPTGFQFESRKRTGRRGDHFGLEVEAILHGPADFLRKSVPFGAVVGLDRDLHMLHRSPGFDINPVLGDFRELPQNGFDARRENIVPADREHVVDPAQDTAIRAAGDCGRTGKARGSALTKSPVR